MEDLPPDAELPKPDGSAKPKGKPDDKVPKQDASKNRPDQFNKFILKELYPDVNDLFSRKILNVDDIKGDCLVVLDTNVLLFPYKIGASSLRDIGAIYRRLSDSDRLYLPAQVVREFAANRSRKLADAYKNLIDYKSRLSGIYNISQHLLLENLPVFEAIKMLETTLKASHKEYIEKLGTLIDHVKGFSWNDPVSSLYTGLPDKKIMECSLDDATVAKDLERRSSHSIPPGSKDKNKDDGGIGDLIIWHTILSIGEQQQVNILFVTEDAKADWWQLGAGQPLYPRYELVDEFYRRSSGHSFQMLSFANFLKVFGAGSDVVDEVEEAAETPVIHSLDFNSNVDMYTVEFLSDIYGETQAVSRALFDYDYEMREKIGKVLHPRGIRLIYSEALEDYRQYFRSRAVEMRNNLLRALGVSLSRNRLLLYEQEGASETSPPQFADVARDLNNLTNQLIEKYPQYGIGLIN